jgi:hypothetical protein
MVLGENNDKSGKNVAKIDLTNVPPSSVSIKGIREQGNKKKDQGVKVRKKIQEYRQERELLKAELGQKKKRRRTIEPV